jgi:hypothetical protein
VPQIILLVLKSGHLDQILINQLGQFNIKFKLPFEGWLATLRVYFRALQYPYFNWEVTAINKDKIFLRMAAFYRYDFNAASLQQFCGWRAIGEPTRQEELLYWSCYILSAVTHPAPRTKCTASRKNTHEQIS